MDATATRRTRRTPRDVGPFRRRSWWPDAFSAVATASILIVVALWVHGGNVQALFAGGGPAVTSIGRLTGLVAADLLLVQVILMGRVPWERTYGQDRLARWHRLVGFTSINLIFAHVAFITLGYAVTAHSSVLLEAWQLATTYPGMLLATAASAAVVMIAVTSVRAARARLRYESWHLLHRYAYLGVSSSAASVCRPPRRHRREAKIRGRSYRKPVPTNSSLCCRSAPVMPALPSRVTHWG
jgi:hypothetical protein